MIEIICASPLHTIQDQGRFGFASQGLANAGSMDSLSAAWANRMVGNDIGTPVFEIAGGGFKAIVTVDTNVGVTGATGDIRIDDVVVRGWGRFPVPKGSIIEIGRITSGAFIYLSFALGLDVESKLKSVATCSRDKLGGLTGCGDPVKAGDFIQCRASRPLDVEFVPRKFVPSFQEYLECDVLLYENLWSLEQQRLFLSQSYAVSSQISRMGYKLICTEKIHTDRLKYSIPVPLGGIQIPPVGHPIVLMRDHQSLGGYPLIGCVTRLSLCLLAQRVPGQLVSFRTVSREQAISDIDRLTDYFGFFY